MAREHALIVPCIQKELEDVFVKFESMMTADEEALLERYLPRFGIDTMIPPAIVLLSARLFGKSGRALLPALFLVFIHLGVTLHSLPQQIQGRDRQMIILEGDHLYSLLFLLLCQTDCLYLLERFSRLLREMNEGSAMRQLHEQGSFPQTDGNLMKILSKQYGLFFAECCELGGLFAGSPQDDLPLLRRFGHDFGLAYGIKEAGLGAGEYMPFLAKALDCLINLRSASGRNELSEFSRMILTTSVGNRFRVAV
jgi:hypothetical protein